MEQWVEFAADQWAEDDLSQWLPGGIDAECTETAGAGDAAAGDVDPAVRDIAGAADAVALESAFEPAQVEAAGAADAAAAETSFEPAQVEAAGARDAADIFNVTEFVRLYADRSIRRFYAFAESPGLPLIELPLESFQATIRSGLPSYLAAVTPDESLYAALEARRLAGGFLRVYQAYIFAGEELVREQVFTADIDNVRLDRGPRSGSVTVEARRAETFAPKTVALADIMAGGSGPGGTFYRCRVDLLVRPGDTALAGNDSFTVGAVQIVAGVLAEYMDVRQAA